VLRELRRIIFDTAAASYTSQRCCLPPPASQNVWYRILSAHIRFWSEYTLDAFPDALMLSILVTGV
jgi:hypothetical protein